MKKSKFQKFIFFLISYMIFNRKNMRFFSRFFQDFENFRKNLTFSLMLGSKKGGRAGLRKFACALHVASSVVCALRALFKNDLLIFTSASARKFLVSRAWSCVVRRIPSGKLSSNLSRVASLFGREERL